MKSNKRKHGSMFYTHSHGTQGVPEDFTGFSVHKYYEKVFEGSNIFRIHCAPLKDFSINKSRRKHCKNYFKMLFTKCPEFLDFQSSTKQIGFRATMHVIIQLKKGHCRPHMEELHPHVVLSSDGCKTFRSMEPSNCKNELGVFQGQVRMSKEF